MITYEILEDNIKFTNLTEKKIKIGFILRLRGTNAAVANYFHTFSSKNEWVIPHFDYTGCSLISVHENLYKDEETGLPIMRELFRVMIPQKFTKRGKTENIICVGLNKSGTSSFTKDVSELGYNLCPEKIAHQYAFPDVYQNDFNSMISLLNNPRYNLFEDVPFSLPKIYKEIYKNRPNDLYVLTIRNSVDNFIDSVLNYYEPYLSHKHINNFSHKQFFHHNYYFVDNIRLYGLHYSFFELWGLENTNNIKQKLKDLYNKHNDDVINFFESKNSSNFMVIDVSKKGELKKLTNWLNIKNNKQDFSWENKSK
jgi:hypothetical protein